ncbi:MAG: hypothetical protein Q9182_002695 [Xanthomendoza sp. 2 TL-2023]
MAPFRRGKSGSRNNFPPPRGASSRGRGGLRGASRGRSATKHPSKSSFHASRVYELGDDPPASSDSISDTGDAKLPSSEDLSLEGSSDSDAAPEKPYIFLLQTLNPRLPDGEPRKKRRRVDSVATSKPTHGPRLEDLDSAEDPTEGASVSEEDSADNSDIVSIAEKHDFFSQHFAEPDEGEILDKIRALEKNHLKAEKIVARSPWSLTLRRPIVSREVGDDSHGTLPEVRDLKLKPKLEGVATRLLSNANEISTQLTASMLSYYDILFPARSLDSADTLRKLISLHVLNHINRTRDRVLKNTAKLSKSSDYEDLELRDQGFTRPKILILLPTRQSCVKIVDAIVSASEPQQQENRKRFQDSFANVEEELLADKPEDFRDLFAGNDDDMFRLGLRITRKTVKFFSQFYDSDIIIASPLGLRTAIGTDTSQKADSDFLSSIEIVVMDQSEALIMQNWEHVDYIFEHLNLQPKEAHDCDFGRVRSWYLDGHAKYLRQTILFSAFNFPALNRLYTQHMLNIAGKIKIAKAHEGAMVELALPVNQTFCRFDFIDPTSEPDNRFSYFATAILPSLIKTSSQNVGGRQGMLIFLPLYADFVRVRNHLATSSTTHNISFGSISEYTPVKDVARARSHFLTGRHSMLLYTERAHHFRRYHLKGVAKVIFYGLPENPLFYSEIVSGYLGSNVSDANADHRHASVRSLFSQLDLMKLERIVGTQRYLSLLSEKGDTFDFV